MEEKLKTYFYISKGLESINPKFAYYVKARGIIKAVEYYKTMNSNNPESKVIYSFSIWNTRNSNQV